jgi:hypothetical protein
MIFWLSYGPWTLKFGQIFSCHHFFSLCLEILTWFLVWECIVISYRSLWNSFWLNDFWPTYSRWALKFGQIFSCHHFISLCYEILTWCLVWACIIISYRSNFNFFFGWMIFDQLTAVGLWNFDKYLVVTTFFSLWFEILTWF